MYKLLKYIQLGRKYGNQKALFLLSFTNFTKMLKFSKIIF